MSHVRTKLYSNGSNITVDTDSDPPFDFSAAKKGTVVFTGENFANTDNTLGVDVYWGARKRGFISNKSNIVWVKDATLTASITSSATIANRVAGVLPIPAMASPLMKLVFKPGGTSKSVKVEAYFEYET